MSRVRHALIGLTAATLTAVGLAAAPGAAAAPDSVTHRPAVAQQQAAAGLDVHRGRFITQGGCETTGRQGVERGHWDQYQCAEGRLFWHLWTNR